MKSTHTRPSFKTDNRRDFVDVSALFGKYVAAWFIERVRHTRIQVLEITALAFLAGLGAAVCIGAGSRAALGVSVFLIQLKNILDTADGGLARARNTPSAMGRYADSVSDFLINAALFGAIAVWLAPQWGWGPALALSGAALLSQLLQCSYYVHYMVRFLGSGEPHGPLDDRHPRWLKFFIACYRVIYAWQDAWVARLDSAMRARTDADSAAWYRQKKLLFLNSFLGLGTQLFIMCLFLILGRPDLFLWSILVAGNLYLAFLITFRNRLFLKKS